MGLNHNSAIMLITNTYIYIIRNCEDGLAVNDYANLEVMQGFFFIFNRRHAVIVSIVIGILSAQFFLWDNHIKYKRRNGKVLLK